MRCPHCDYELWHCVGRTCPECGEGFSLFDFTFEQEYVRFHCPTCDEAFEGVPPRGRPDHNRQACEKCNSPIHMESYIVKPLPGYDTELDGRPLPFNAEDKSFFLAGMMSTIGFILTKPNKVMGRVSPKESIWRAWKLFLLVYGFTLLLYVLSSMFLFNFAILAGESVGVTDMLIIGGQALGSGVATLLFVFLWTAVATAVIHCSGGSSYPMKRTLQAILYSGCTMVFTIVPCAGSLIAFIWWIIAASIMFQRAHRITTGRAICAGLSGLVALLLPCCLIWGAFMYPALQQARTAAMNAQQNVQLQMQPPEPPELTESQTPLEPPLTERGAIDQSSTQQIPAE